MQYHFICSVDFACKTFSLHFFSSFPSQYKMIRKFNFQFLFLLIITIFSSSYLIALGQFLCVFFSSNIYFSLHASKVLYCLFLFHLRRLLRVKRGKFPIILPSGSRELFSTAAIHLMYQSISQN